MAAGQSIIDVVNGGDEKTKLSSIPPQRSNALSQKISSVLSASYLDLEIKEALRHLDAKNIQNSSGVRRRLRLDVQKEMIDCNRGIISEFGQVAKVCLSLTSAETLLAKRVVAIRTNRPYCYKS